MSQRDGFASGFFFGAVVGGVVGGVLGTIVASRNNGELAAQEEGQIPTSPTEAKKASFKRRQMKASETDSIEMETARRSLEDKIAQLNATIDEVRQQLGSVNSNSNQIANERSLTKDA
ncbi:MAG: hypothetical protein HXY43_23460 [Fischerella sp.]|jgi:gas vesicle protein|uniref:hypothetical protein n=1 Tax=unclassified Fischerella TaxID=494603 RepID=UPI00047AD1C1|nr:MULTISPECIES: hypothetical protein [unclassified Fischerella]NWF62132.1 hypothetical protein [Fischerella sp.]